MKPPRDQHFLIDQNAIRRIADLVNLDGRVVLEIGPGEGSLTRALIDRGAYVHAVEIDRQLCEELTDRFSAEIAEGRLTITHGDAVRCPLPPFSIVVSNLPYSASSKLTFRLLDAGFEVAVLMYQSEFAQRMTAPAGTGDCGRLSVMVQTYATVEPCFELSPASFRPKPQVRSMVVRITPKKPDADIPDRRLYADVVRALFNHRRKTVRNGLKSAGAILSEVEVVNILSSLPKSILDARPEDLTLEDFAAITRCAWEHRDQGERAEGP
ncbi:MAG: 16S ribosomal RNA methyltransferase A [Methanoregulaceae archaeon]|nr:16S ribosomal RNA methyltransferase A [Methanoregulaceae archaeon]